MPIFEFDEMESARVVDGVQLYNYWGYNTVSFFAPNTSYAFNEEHNHEGDELKSLIKALKENGIEVILDVVFNHTAEGNEMGPCFSFKGIDNGPLSTEWMASDLTWLPFSEETKTVHLWPIRRFLSRWHSTRYLAR